MRTKDGDTGKLHCSVLLPEANVEKIGGPGKDCWVFGENYPNAATTRPDPCNERGAWRVEVTPKTAAKEDCFLNVIQVAETSCKKMLPVQRIDADKVVGVSVADRVVTFSRDSKALSEEFCFEIPKSAGKSIKVLVTDLAPGKWTVLNGKKVIEQAQVDPESGSLYFTASPGKYTVTR
jgi:heparin/heparan-sulfate lyase